MTLNFDALTAFTQTLVRVETLSGEEKPAADLVQTEMSRLGFDKIYVDENGSVVGSVKGAHAGPTLLFDAHCDTVGVAPGVPWEYEPYGAKIENGRLYGRGSSDMKGALAAMLYAAAAVDRAQLRGTVVISASVMEEVMEGFALKTVMNEVHPDMVVIGEPTNLNLSHGGRGRAEIHLEAIGKPTHSSSPQLGINAVHVMIEAIQAIEALRLPTDPLIGEAIIALTDIISEPFPGHSVIPSRCRVTYDRRLLPGETVDSVLNPLKALPQTERVSVELGEGEYTTYMGAVLKGRKFFPAWKLQTDHQFVEQSLAGLRQAGLSPQLRAYRFCTNAAYSAGVAKVPTIGFGPSPEGHAHMVDEYIELSQLHDTARGYLAIIEAMLGAG